MTLFPQGVAVFLPLAELNFVYPITRLIKSSLFQYIAVLNMAGYISSESSDVTQTKIIQEYASITEDVEICCCKMTRKYSKWKITTV
jgi:hypothetical protein